MGNIKSRNKERRDDGKKRKRGDRADRKPVFYYIFPENRDYRDKTDADRDRRKSIEKIKNRSAEKTGDTGHGDPGKQRDLAKTHRRFADFDIIHTESTAAAAFLS